MAKLTVVFTDDEVLNFDLGHDADWNGWKHDFKSLIFWRNDGLTYSERRIVPLTNVRFYTVRPNND